MLVESLMVGSSLDSVEHKQCVRQAGAKARKEGVKAEVAFVDGLKDGASKAAKKKLERIGKTEAWLIVMP